MSTRLFRPNTSACARLAVAAALTTPLCAGAALHVYEPFDYAAPSILDGTAATGRNLAGAYESLRTDDFRLRVSTPGLGYGGLVGAPTASGGKLTQLQGTTQDDATVGLAQPIEIAAGGALYFSALFTFDDSSNGNRRAGISLIDGAGGGEITFGETAVGVRALRATANTAATGGLVATAGSMGTFSDGQTLLLIGRYENGANPLGDRLELLGYDTAASHVLPATFDPADPNVTLYQNLDEIDIDLSRVSSIRFTIRGDDNNYIDELRIGSSFADVAAIPEPHAWLLMLCGMGVVTAGVRARHLALR